MSYPVVGLQQTRYDPTCITLLDRCILVTHCYVHKFNIDYKISNRK